MTDQPKPDKDESPEGYRPPSYIPAQESDVPAAPAPPATTEFEQPGYGRQPSGAQGYAGEQVRPGEQYREAAPDYNQQADPYGTPSPYAQQPYAQQSYGGQPQYGQPQYGQPGTPFNAYGQPAYYGLPPEPKGLSIASLCCGIATFVGLGFFLLPQLAAVILGHMALKREPAGKGMAIAGLVMGYVGIALTVLIFVLIAVGLAVGRSTFGTSGA
ncbi:DUF4190 domain-containing protein [Arthrobacter sp. U41]|uniref:DUF4190 domain-containing protein n=1 Tax=Arthrobacter sp. U41 TaxID=1849032 RepID=UPI0011A80ED1|nr:DUF4190 domain-containing protein [Arthrobacter sp. U41]